MPNKKKYHGEDFNNNPLIGLPTPTTQQTTAAANVQFVLNNAGGTVKSVNSQNPDGSGNIALNFSHLANKPSTVAGYGITDAYTKTEIDSKTSVIFTTVTDEFTDLTKVATNDNMTLDSGSIRPKIAQFVDSLTDKKYMDEDLTSTEIDVNISAGGSASVVSGATGYDFTLGSNKSNTRSFVSEPFAFSQAITSARLKASFTTSGSGLTGLTSPETTTIENNISGQIYSTNGLHAIYEDTTSGATILWQFAKSNASLNNYVLSDGTNHTVIDSATYNFTTSDTLRHNVAIYATSTDVFVSYPIAANSFRIKKMLKSDRSVSTVDTITISGATIQQMDIAYQNNRLHVIYSRSDNRTIVYNFYNSSLVANGTPATLVTISSPTTTIPYSVRFVKKTNDSVRLGWAAFFTAQSYFGIVDTTKNTSPYQFRNVAATASTAEGVSSITTACNGVGDIVFDTQTSLFYVGIVSTLNNALRLARIGNAIDSAIPTTTPNLVTLTTVPYNSMGGRNLIFYLETSSKLHLLYSNSTRTEIDFSTVNMTGTPAHVSGTDRTVSVGTEVYPTGFVLTNSSPLYYDTYYLSSDIESARVSYKANILPKLFGKIGDAARVELTNDVSQTFTFTSSANQVVRLEFEYPIQVDFYSGSIRSVTLTEYMIEQVTPTPTFGTSFGFTSVPLITDRIVTSATLNVLQTVPSLQGNAIVWEMAALGDNWVTVNQGNNWTANFGANPGTQLRVKASVTRGQTAVAISDLPSIQSYAVTTSNVVVVSELLPLQLNVLKMGLKLEAMTQLQTTELTNMYVDTFTYADQAAAVAAGITFNSPAYYNATLKQIWLSDGSAESPIEEADKSIVSTILVLCSESNNSDVYFQASRDGGTTWSSTFTVTANNGGLLQFTGSESVKNRIKIRAVTGLGSRLNGWAYLYA